MLTEYRNRPMYLEKYCLADFASELRIQYPKNVTFEDPFDDNLDDDPVDPEYVNISDKHVMEHPN